MYISYSTNGGDPPPLVQPKPSTFGGRSTKPVSRTSRSPGGLPIAIIPVEIPRRLARLGEGSTIYTFSNSPKQPPHQNVVAGAPHGHGGLHIPFLLVAKEEETLERESVTAAKE